MTSPVTSLKVEDLAALGRADLIAFTRLTKANYRAADMHWKIGKALKRIESGEIDRLMVFMPPRHGKSELVSVRFPSWYLGRHPDRRIITVSYADALSRTFGRKARNSISTRQYQAIFPGIRIASDSFAANEWNIANHDGGYIAAGVGGPITGHGAHVAVIDDPIKNREEANSLVFRDSVWEWYNDVLVTRLEEHGAIVLTMCMTGDTPVLMADRTERPLRDIRIGDQVATYDKGKLGISTVQNHRSNGADSVYRITTTSGRIVHANERHPFLVEEHGQLKWIQLRNLTTAHTIVTVKDSGASGKERLASLMAARNPLARGVIAFRITAKRGGQTGIAPYRIAHRPAGLSALNNGTASPPLSTMQCLKRKVASALSADNLQARMYERIGVDIYALTTAMAPTQSEGSCATTAILPWDTLSQKQLYSPWLHTSDFTTEAIESIEPAGIEEVFDVQIERTENFIANGLVSHNTRWHLDDLAGRLLEQEPTRWTVLRLPAIAEHDDPLGRVPGDPLWPEKYPIDVLEELQATDLDFDALYQQNPTVREGATFDREWFKGLRYDASDQAYRNRCIGRWISFDTGMKDKGTSDYTACTVAELMPDYRLLIREIWRERMQFPALVSTIEAMAKRHNQDFKLRGVVVEDKVSGTSALQTLRQSAPAWLQEMLIGFEPMGSKLYRAQQAAVWARNSCILLPAPSDAAKWLMDAESELFNFPSVAHDDRVDSLVQIILFLERMLSEGFRARAEV